jgi:Protein of unknown function (DUF2971)
LPKASSKEPGTYSVMDRWLDILKDEPSPTIAPTLHHYTDAFGVSGIISSNCLWATATQFSNDVSEIEYSVSVAMRVIQETWKVTTGLSPWERILVEHLVHLFSTPLHSFGQPFIVSLCEAGDLLSQWRGYGQASGFSLAFKSLNQDDELKLACKHGFRTGIKQVIYEPNKQRARLRFLLRRLIKMVNGFAFKANSTEGASAHVELSLILVLVMTDWACSVKHESFSEEREWRIVTYPKGATLNGVHPQNFEGVSVRPTARLLLPYMTLEPLQGKRLPLLEVRCGPSQFQEQSSRAMQILLRNHGYNNLPITLSTVPLRT